MRTRQFDNRIGVPSKFRWGHTISSPNPTWTTSVVLKGELTDVVDEVNTRFQERSKSGEVINTPFSLTRSFVDPSQGPYVLSGPNGGGAYFADYTSAYFPPAPVISSDTPRVFGISTDFSVMRDRVGTSAMAKVGASNIKGLVSLGELGETLRYLRNPLGQGLKLASSIERKLSKRVLNNSPKGGLYRPGLLAKQVAQRPSGPIHKEIANLYLELMYGLRPLVKEISELVEQVSASPVLQKPRETARARETQGWQATIVTPNKSYGAISATETLVYSLEVEVRAGCMYHYFAELSNANRSWGVRFEDIPSAIWALHAGSFVVDWFVNTNEYIQALTPIGGLVKDAVWTSVTTTETLARTCTGYRLDAWPQPVTSSGGTSPSISRMIRKNRTPTINVALAPTQITSGLKDLSLSQTATLFALFTQRLAPLVGEFDTILRK